MYPGKPHAVSYFYFFGSAVPNYYENINRYMAKKLEILSEHKSQFPDFGRVEKWVKEYLSSFTKKYKYSEAFRVMNIEQVFK